MLTQHTDGYVSRVRASIIGGVACEHTLILLFIDLLHSQHSAITANLVPPT